MGEHKERNIDRENNYNSFSRQVRPLPELYFYRKWRSYNRFQQYLLPLLVLLVTQWRHVIQTRRNCMQRWVTVCKTFTIFAAIEIYIVQNLTFKRAQQQFSFENFYEHCFSYKCKIMYFFRILHGVNCAIGNISDAKRFHGGVIILHTS